MKENIHEKRVNFMISNNLSVAEAAEILNLDVSSIYRSLKKVNKKAA